jgi:hypothetical protein
MIIQYVAKLFLDRIFQTNVVEKVKQTLYLQYIFLENRAGYERM